MANIKAAQKHIRTSRKRAEANKKRKSEIKTAVRHFENALENNEIDKATELIKDIERKTQRAVHKNIMHQNAASRKVSKLTKKLNNAM